MEYSLPACFNDDDIPQFTEDQVKKVLREMNTRKSNVNGNIPARIFKEFSDQLAKPVMIVISIKQLRNISGLLHLDKIAEKLVSELIISDMREKLDPSQYANQKGLSIQHYLIRFIDRILSTLDKSFKRETCSVLATLVDLKQAFPRQCPKLGVESFIKNGVRPALIPLLVNYFQGRQIKVK